MKIQINNRWTGSVIFETDAANLGQAILIALKSRADLRGADLCDADLRGAKNAELPIAMTRILPDGDLIGWKKCRNGALVKLLIPEIGRAHV